MNVERLQRFVEKKIGEPDSVEGADYNYVCPFCEQDGARHHLHINWSKGDHGVCICHGCLYKNGSALAMLRELSPLLTAIIIAGLRPMRLFMLAGVGGALGSGARYLVNVGAARWLGVKTPVEAVD